jgi:hypothetical protein
MSSGQANGFRGEALRLRRMGYSIAAAAAANAAADANAVVVYSGIEDFNITQRNYLPLGLDGNNLPDVYLQNYVDPVVGKVGNYQGAFLGFAPGRFVAKQAGPQNLGYIRALGAGFLVDTSSVHPNVFTASLAFGAHNPNAEFNNVENAYIGFRFASFDSSSFPLPPADQRAQHYGWVRVSINNAAGTFVVHDWAWESEPSIGILTGDKGAAGDFNDDGRVDAADYTVWRDNLGTDHILGGHGDENGDSLNVVDMDDYTLWKANFGWVAPASPALASAVPEPGTLGMLAAGSLGLALWRRLRRHD